MTAPISLFEKREELRRVLQSKYFAGAPKKTRFLEFVSEQAFLGNGDKLNEYLVGLEVYERGSDFNPQKDPIVRVQAHEIRRLLKRYYQEDGRDNMLRIDLPSGHYVPVFGRNGVENAEESTSSDGTAASPRRWNGLHVAATVVLAAACVVLSFLWITSDRRNVQSAASRKAVTRLPDELEWFWRPFLPPADLAPVEDHVAHVHRERIGTAGLARSVGCVAVLLVAGRG